MSLTMKAVRCHRYVAFNTEGELLTHPDPLSDALSLVEIPKPECDDGYVLVEVYYA